MGLVHPDFSAELHSLTDAILDEDGFEEALHSFWSGVSRRQPGGGSLLEDDP